MRDTPRKISATHIVLFVGFLILSTVLLTLSFKSRPSRIPPQSHPVQFQAHQSAFVDIDIGTLGTPIDSKASRLITFDPFDELLVSEKYERYPYIVADFSGPTDFYINDFLEGCSTLNKRNERYDPFYREQSMKRNCVTNESKLLRKAALDDFNSSWLKECMHAPLRKVQVEAITLSSFLPKINVSHINFLKIDAQGSDFAILKDLFEHAAHIIVNTILVECQLYDQGVPLYFTSNDCNEIASYVSRKFPSARFKWTDNNCLLKEFNLEISNLNQNDTISNPSSL